MGGGMLGGAERSLLSAGGALRVAPRSGGFHDLFFLLPPPNSSYVPCSASLFPFFFLHLIQAMFLCVPYPFFFRHLFFAKGS